MISDSKSCNMTDDLLEEVEITPKEYNDILNFQQKILNMIASRDNYSIILKNLCELAECLLPNSVASIMMVNQTTGLMSVLSAPSVPPVGHDALENLNPGIYGGSCGNAVFHNQPQYVSNTFKDSRWKNIRQIALDFNLCSCWSMPIRDDIGNAIGSFALSSFEHRSPSSFHKKLLEVSSSIVNIVLKNKKTEQKLTLFSSAMQNASEGMIITNENNNIIEVNQAFLDIYGYQEKDILGLNPNIFSSGTNSKTLYPDMWKGINTDSKWSGEIINKDANGNEIIQWLSISSIQDQESYLAIFTDLTQIRKVQDELSREKTFLKTLLKGLPDLIWLKDIDGHYLSCNSRFEDFFDRKEKDILGKTDYDFVDKEQADIFRLKDKYVMDNHKNLMNEEKVIFANDGHIELVEKRKIPMLNENGKMLGVLGVARDITERKSAENELIKLSLAVEQSYSIIIMCDVDDNVEYANKAFYDFFDEYNSIVELKEEHLQICHKFEEYDHPSYIQAKEVNGIRWIDYVKEHPNNAFKVAIKKEDVLHHFIIRVAQANSQSDSFLVIELRDVSQDVIFSEQIKEKEKILFEQSKMAALGEMIGNIAHQWRQPLSIISTGVTGMQVQKEYGHLTDEIFDSTCEMINNNAQYLSKTIDDFKNFIKGDREKKEFNLSENINSFLNLVEGSIKNHNIEIVLNLDNDICMKGYENELTQCIINIFNNAKDVLDDSTQINKIFYIESKIKDDKVEIIFKDNAGGIAASSLPNIFDPYFTTKHPTQGTGLGLSMAYSIIVDGMEGMITAKNDEFVINDRRYYGAIFKIVLPK